MPFCRTLLALVLLTSIAWGGELRTLKGENIPGDLVSINDKEVVFARGGKDKINVPAGQVLLINIGSTMNIPTGTKYIRVELTDGTLLNCSAFSIKGKEAELTPLLTGQAIKLPLNIIANVLTSAQEEKYRKDWTERIGKKRQRDLVALLRDDVVNGLEGTIGEADAEGKNLSFTLSSGRKADIPLERIHGLFFKRTPDANAPPVVCKLSDSYQNLVMAASVTTTPTGLAVVTPSGAKLDYTLAQLAKLDFSKGRLTYLSELDPVVRLSPRTAEVKEGLQAWFKDSNSEHPPRRIQLKGVSYDKGLSIFSGVELEFNLDGDYQEFKAVVGIDDNVKGQPFPVDLIVLRDGQEIKKLTLSRTDKERTHTLQLNIKDAQKLKIVVTSDDLSGLGQFISLADAKVSK